MGKVEERLETSIEKAMDKMSSMADSLMANQEKLQASTSALSGTAETFQKLTLNMDTNVKVATETSDQLSNTVSSYKEAILKSASLQHHQPHSSKPALIDPKVLRDMDRKARQISLLTCWTRT